MIFDLKWCANEGLQKSFEVWFFELLRVQEISDPAPK